MVSLVVFPQPVESNALLTPWASREGWLLGVMSKHLIPADKVRQACERVRLPRLPREVRFAWERLQSGERHSDTQRISRAEGTEERVLPLRSLAFGASLRRRHPW